jgi:signal transduction histidine kinase
MIRALVVAQTDTLARGAAASITDRYAVVRSDILLLSENAEVQHLLRILPGGDSTAIRGVTRAAADYLESVWRLAGETYYTAELTDARGVRLWYAGSDTASRDIVGRPATINGPVRDVESNRIVGALALAPRATAFWPRDLFAPSFGRTGYGIVIDRATNQVFLPPNSAMVRMTARQLVGAAWGEDSARVSRGSGTLVYTQHDSVRVASYVSLDSPPWTVLSSTALDEFAAPFARANRFNLIVLGLFIGGVSVLFVIFIGSATRSLEELTRAAASVGRGDLSPVLPSGGRDEVGTLSNAFADMTSRIRSMMREVEVSRQLAVLGEFAAQLAHEVRNPLTSLKLDLQGLQRQVRSGVLPPSAEAPVASSLREVNRLDTVVRGVLALAHQPGAEGRPVSLDEVLDHSVAALRTQLEQRSVIVERQQYREPTHLIGDPELLSGMFMNLLINAADAQPGGGRVGVTSLPRRDDDGREWVDVTIADDGPGVAADQRHDIFRPFHTSRHDGTGLGLALALRTARDHGGHIACDSATDGFTGAAFIVSLPVPMP